MLRDPDNFTMASKDISQSPRASDSASSQQRQGGSATSSAEPSQPQAVRFASVNQEIEPAHSLHSISTLPSQYSSSDAQFSPEAQEEIRNLSRSIQSSQLQQRRMTHFAFEPVSLPTSRVSQVCDELGSEPSILLSVCLQRRITLWLFPQGSEFSLIIWTLRCQLV